MVIVSGTIDLDPRKRGAFIAEHLDVIRRTRAEKGCLACAYAADPIDLGRVLLFERWATQQDFDAHVALAQARAESPRPHVGANVVSVSVYEVAGERWLGGWDQDLPVVPAFWGRPISSPQRPNL